MYPFNFFVWLVSVPLKGVWCPPNHHRSGLLEGVNSCEMVWIERINGVHDRIQRAQDPGDSELPPQTPGNILPELLWLGTRAEQQFCRESSLEVTSLWGPTYYQSLAVRKELSILERHRMNFWWTKVHLKKGSWQNLYTTIVSSDFWNTTSFYGKHLWPQTRGWRYKESEANRK